MTPLVRVVSFSDHNRVFYVLILRRHQWLPAIKQEGQESTVTLTIMKYANIIHKHENKFELAPLSNLDGNLRLFDERYLTFNYILKRRCL